MPLCHLLAVIIYKIFVHIIYEFEIIIIINFKFLLKLKKKIFFLSFELNFLFYYLYLISIIEKINLFVIINNIVFKCNRNIFLLFQ